MAKASSYPIKYTIEPGQFTPEQLAAAGAGGCDQIGLLSVMGKFGEGNLSTLMIGVQGDGSDWTDDQWFQVWALMAKKLTDSKTLGAGRKAVAEMAFKTVRAAILSARGLSHGKEKTDS